MGTGNTTLEINGKVIWKPGYTVGQRTGALPYSEGSHKFVVKREGCLPAETSLPVERGKAQTLIGYAEEIFDEDGNSLGYQIKIARMRQHTPEKGLVVTFVSFCKDEKLDLVIEEAMSGETFIHAVDRRRSSRLKLVDEGRVRAVVKHDGEPIGTIKVDELGNYVVMIFENEKGEKQLQTFYDPEFMISGS
ncbi:MAG: hypothetical protein AAGC74_05360 [Verrucomicrobiota bacterium]